MKIIISPAKKLATDNFINKGTSVQFLEETNYLIEELKACTVSDIKHLMNLSDKLAQLNWQRFQNWNAKGLGQAIFMFKGDVYKGIKPETLSNIELDFAQENLRILSGLYGLLKPKDLIYPYRLEMGTKLRTKTGNNLYKFWEDRLHQILLSELKNGEEIINLASEEYSKAIHLNNFTNPVITPVFKDYKNGKLKVISFYAKRARGEMCNYIIKNKIANAESLKSFSNLGYQFTEEIKKGEFLFAR